MTQQRSSEDFSQATPIASPGPIVLGTEFGPVSSAAERVAIRLAARAGVPLLVVHGIDPGRLRLPGGRFLQRVDQARAARQADACARTQHALIGRFDACGALSRDQQREIDSRLHLAATLEHRTRAAGGPRAAVRNGGIGQCAGRDTVRLCGVDAHAFHRQPRTAFG
jgi:hypothetical protein